MPESGYMLAGVTVAAMINRDLVSGKTINGYGASLKSYFDCDEGGDDDTERTPMIREAVAEISRTIDNPPCHLEKDLLIRSK